MENKRTEELRKYKASVKSKLMAAIAMLMVSTILLSSTTYAWFVLSTAPEVKGMSTTVGSNGSLEIALLGDAASYDAALAQITSGTSDSVAATNNATVSNLTWGNIVDLNTLYGLQNVTLYPSALNLTQNDDKSYSKTLADAGQLLKIPSYGYDGRIAELKPDTYAGKLEEGIFVYDPSYYGVRAVGSYTNADPTAAALLAARSGYATSLQNAVNLAKNTALSATNSAGLTRLLVKYALTEANSDALAMTLTPTDFLSIYNILVGLEEVTTQIESAIKYAIVAEDISTNGSSYTKTFDNALDNYTSGTYYNLVTELNTLKETIANQKTTALSVDAYDEMVTPLDDLMDLDSMKIDGKTVSEVQALENKTSWAAGLLNDAVIEANGADSTLVKTANMISTFSSGKFSAQLDDDDTTMTMTGATITVNQSVAENQASMVVAGRVVAEYTVETEGGSERPTIQPQDTYGYIVDLAFRASTDTSLLLSAAQTRVSGETATDLQGNGSNFTVDGEGEVDEEAMAEMVEALRIVFLGVDGRTIVGVAGLSETPNEINARQYDLIPYEYRIDANGGIELLYPKGYTLNEESGEYEGTVDYFIMNLTADTATGLSVLVYLDGNYTDSSMTGVSGKLNLQFASSVTLTPMDYNDWVAASETTSMAITATVPEGYTSDITVQVLANGQDSDQTVTLKAADGYKYTVSGLPTTVEGQAVTYTIGTVTVESGYKTTVNGYAITVEADEASAD